jgi:hypothetical protein
MLHTELEQLLFFEGVKIELDIASDFCERQIERIKNFHNYREKFFSKEDDNVLNTHPYFDDHEIFIKEQFTSDPDHPWTYFFYNEEDYHLFVNSLKEFFSNAKYDELSKIQIKQNCLTRLCNILHDIYFFCSPLKQLKRDKKFQKLIKTLPPFSDLPLPRIYDKLIHY